MLFHCILSNTCPFLIGSSINQYIYLYLRLFHLFRHNVIMETPEAKAKSAELHRIMLEEKKLKNPSAGDDDDDEDEGEADENEDGSSGDDENQVSL